MAGCSRVSRWFCSWSSCAAFGCFAVAVAFDVVDFFSGGYKPDDYARANPLINMISYCNSTADFLAASVATAFLLLKKDKIMKTTVLLEALATRQSNIQQSIRKSLRNLWIYFLVFTICISTCTVIRYMYTDSAYSLEADHRYATLMAPPLVMNLYFSVAVFIAALTNYIVKSLFAYFTSFLQCFSSDLHVKSARFLRSLEESRGSWSSEHYTDQLRNILRQSEQICEAFDSVEDTFSGKLLWDVTLNLAAMCIHVASLSIWSLNPRLNASSMLDLTMNLLVIAAKLLCMRAVFGPAVSLYQNVGAFKALMSTGVYKGYAEKSGKE